MHATYPDEQSPIVLLKLGRRVPDGVGPDGDVVAYNRHGGVYAHLISNGHCDGNPLYPRRTGAEVSV